MSRLSTCVRKKLTLEVRKISGFNPGLVLLQDRNDLLFRMPLALHRLVLSQGQTPVHPGSIQWGNVMPTEHPDNPDQICFQRLAPTARGKLETAINGTRRSRSLSESKDAIFVALMSNGSWKTLKWRASGA